MKRRKTRRLSRVCSTLHMRTNPARFEAMCISLEAGGGVLRGRLSMRSIGVWAQTGPCP